MEECIHGPRSLSPPMLPLSAPSNLPKEAVPEEFDGVPVPAQPPSLLHDTMKEQHEAVMTELQLQSELLRQVLMNTSLESLGSLIANASENDEAPDSDADVISPLHSGNDKIASPKVLSPGSSGNLNGEVSQAVTRTRRPSLLSSLRSYTDEDLGRLDAAQSRHGDLVRQRFLARNLQQPLRTSVAWGRARVQKWVQSSAFEMFFGCVVFTNAVFIGVEVQASIDDPERRPVVFDVAQYTFTSLFVLELALRLVSSGWRKMFCTEVWYWSVLDVVIIISSLWEIAAALQTDVDAVGGVSSLKAFRIIRLTRTLRTVQFVRIFRFVVALRTLLKSIAYTLKALTWALLLLALIIYVFAVMFSQAVNDYLADPDSPPLPEREHEACLLYFGSLRATMTSLFMSIAGGTNWEELVFPLELISPVWTVIFLFYISFTYFAVLNVVTGFFCQGAIESAQRDESQQIQALVDNKEAHLKRIEELFCEIGQADLGITFHGFQERVQEPAVRAYFETLGLDIRDDWSFFKLLDQDGDGIVAVEEFFYGCLKFRGGATAMDVAQVHQDQRWLITKYGHGQVAVEEELQQLKEQMTMVTRLLVLVSGRVTINI